MSDSTLRQAFRAAAAVRASFDPKTLAPLGNVRAEPGAAFLELYEDSFVPYGRARGNKTWMLKADVRRAALGTLGTREALIRALDANSKTSPQTTLGRMLEAYLRGNPSSVEEQSTEELAATLQVMDWLEGIVALPERRHVENALGVKRLFEPFTALTRYFAGRETELEWLREFVGVIRADAPLQLISETLVKGIRLLLKVSKKNPKLIWGTGGVGKSTLVYEFIQRHVQVHPQSKFPFVYLDFANPELRLDAPATLTAEALRQLALQYPDHPELSSGSAPGPLSVAGFAARVSAVSARVTGLRGIADLPLVMVFDSFEEVQYRGLTPELNLVELFLELQAAYPNLRAVISGRAKPQEIAAKLSLGKDDEREIKDFDEAAATAYLANLSVDIPQFRKALFDQVGGNPLSLHLAAQVYLQEGGNDKGIIDLTTSKWLLKVADSQIQGQLYERILGHLHDPDIQKLAHPGLVLRRITAEIIRHVLQVPCGVDVPDDATAGRLFEDFKKEVALITVADDGSIHHRSDVRRMMLANLKLDKFPQVEQIEQAAIAYYSKQTGTIARAEEIYHLLRRCAPTETIEQRWMKGVEPYLTGAMEVDELGPQQRLYLSGKLGRTVDPKLRAQANLGIWERYVTSVAKNKMIAGYYDDALALLRERTDRTSASPVSLFEVKALIGKGSLTDALTLLPEAVRHEEQAGDPKGLLQCAAASAIINGRLGDIEGALRDLEWAGTYAQRVEDRARMAKILLYRHDLAEPSKRAELLPGLSDALAKLTLGERSGNPMLVRSLEFAVDPSKPQTPVYDPASGYDLLSGMAPVDRVPRPSGETFERFLSPDDLAVVVQAGTRLAFGESSARASVFAGIDTGLVARLPLHPTPSLQIQSDLVQLNTIGRMPDGQAPLFQWLRNAVHDAQDPADIQVFMTAIEKASYLLEENVDEFPGSFPGSAA